MKRSNEQIQVKGIQYYLGVFDKEEEAANMFNVAALHFGKSYRNIISLEKDKLLGSQELQELECKLY
jgi:hypothetical protein